ncbi:MAG: hypothetical protein KAI59_00090 [Planctomycetes bacterium]|nr:hypothetical protein [Planctomycetota bacterium]MCK5472401.1 hypothetical protein [Planctomycetota bacterium]
MSLWRLHIIIVLFLLAGCQEANVGRNKSVYPKTSIKEPKPGKQLKINQDALLKGSSEQIRIDAAGVILVSPEPAARRTLLEALTQKENIAAQIAICKALSQARATQEEISAKEDFIEPLFAVLTAEDSAAAKLAAEAMLIFEYDKIANRLETTAADTSLAASARVNVVYALKLQPDTRAIFKLLELLDNTQPPVAAAAKDALKSLGVPAGKNARARKQIVEELKRKGRNEFLRDWLIRQESQMKILESERDAWRQMYLASLGKLYENISDDTQKSAFLSGHLASEKVTVKLWALDMVSQWRVGTASKFPVELGPVLIGLVGDNDRDVRLKTAKLLSLMGQLDSAEKLLEQLKVETDEHVQMELFSALGGACYYAFLPNSQITVAPEIRKETLGFAADYLSQPDAKKAQKGAEVIGKLLEKNGLDAAEVEIYFDLLVKRYEQQKTQPQGAALRGELLATMAGLCAKSVYKTESAKYFEPLFKDGLQDESNMVREAAVDGLIYIDKSEALKTLRKDFVNDSSPLIRKKLTELAGEIGSENDLVWLLEKVGSTAESESAWQAMLKIFKRSQANALSPWLEQFDSQGAMSRLPDEQKISFLKIAELKAAGENKAGMLENAREKLASLYIKSSQFEQAAEYLGMLRETAIEPEKKDAILTSLLEVYLKWPNLEAATQLVNNYLLAKDLKSDDAITHSIDDYFNKPNPTSDPNTMLTALSKIEIGQKRPMWQRQLERWQKQLNKPISNDGE